MGQVASADTGWATRSVFSQASRQRQPLAAGICAQKESEAARHTGAQRTRLPRPRAQGQTSSALASFPGLPRPSHGGLEGQGRRDAGEAHAGRSGSCGVCDRAQRLPAPPPPRAEVPALTRGPREGACAASGASGGSGDRPRLASDASPFVLLCFVIK